MKLRQNLTSNQEQLLEHLKVQSAKELDHPRPPNPALFCELYFITLFSGEMVCMRQLYAYMVPVWSTVISCRSQPPR